MYTIDGLKELPEEFKGDITARFYELSDQYWNRLEDEYNNLAKKDKDESDWRKIVEVGYHKKDAEKMLKDIDALADSEKEVCEIHRIKRTGNYILIVGPVSERRWFFAWHGIEI